MQHAAEVLLQKYNLGGGVYPTIRLAAGNYNQNLVLSGAVVGSGQGTTTAARILIVGAGSGSTSFGPQGMSPVCTPTTSAIELSASIQVSLGPNPIGIMMEKT